MVDPLYGGDRGDHQQRLLHHPVHGAGREASAGYRAGVGGAHDAEDPEPVQACLAAERPGLHVVSDDAEEKLHGFSVGDPHRKVEEQFNEYLVSLSLPLGSTG